MRLYTILVLLCGLAISEPDKPTYVSSTGTHICGGLKGIHNTNSRSAVGIIQRNGTISSELYAAVKQVDGKWMGLGLEESPYPELGHATIFDKHIGDVPAFTCVKYCEWTGTRFYAFVSDVWYASSDYRINGGILVSCYYPSDNYMFVDGKRADFNEVICTKAGWFSKFKELEFYQLISADTANPMKLECKPAPPRCTYQIADGDTGIHFDKSWRKLTCTSSDNFKKLVVNSYWNLASDLPLKCGDFADTYAWYTKGAKIIVEAVEPITVACVDFCMTSGDWVRDTTTEGVVIVTCADPNLHLFYSNQPVVHSTAKCDIRKRWTGSKLMKIDDHRKKTMHFECKKICVTTGDGISVTKNDETVEVTCAGSDEYLFTSNQHVSRSKATCGAENGWTLGFKLVDDIITPMQFECRKVPQHHCKHIPVQGIQFDASINTLTCDSTDMTLAAIKVNSTRYKSLQCDWYDGWFAGDQNVAEASVALDASCVEYCASKSTGILIKKNSENEIGFTESCTGTNSLLFQGDNRVKSGSCSLNDGWKLRGDSDLVVAETSTPLQFECRNVVPCALQDATGKRFVDNLTGKKLTCIGEENSLSALMLHSQRYEFLECDSGKWKYEGNELATAYTPLDVKCVEDCASSGAGIVVKKYDTNAKEIEVKCADTSFNMYHNGQPALGKLVICKLNKGWFGGKEVVGEKITSDTATPMQFECRPPPTTTTTTPERNPEDETHHKSVDDGRNSGGLDVSCHSWTLLMIAYTINAAAEAHNNRL